jgi:multisubunit Na+/H+ antiporter MnhB subunit
MGVTGALALVMFVIGGIQWMTAAGNSERVKKGRDTLMWAVLGLIVIFSSYAILRAVLEALQF